MSAPLPTEEEMLNYRMKHFAVEVKKSQSASYGGELSLSVTHNGYQWSSISLLPCEARRVILELENHLKELAPQ